MARQNKLGLRDTIPEPIKRAVRQRCGFGCVVCGAALCDYEHFDPEFKDCTEHRAEGITLLCPTHHRSKGGTLSVSEIFDANENPYLRRVPVQAYPDLFFSPPYEIYLGTNSFTLVENVITVQDRRMIWITQGEFYGQQRPLLNAVFRKPNGEPMVSIEENILKHSSKNWDVVSTRNSVQVRGAKGKFDFEAKFLEGGFQVTRLRAVFDKGLALVIEDGALWAEEKGKVGIVWKHCRTANSRNGMVF